MNDLGRKRLMILAGFLSHIPEHRLDMRHWIVPNFSNSIEVFYGERRYSPFLAEGLDNLLKCDTVACAAGWACTIQEFREDGLTQSRTGSPVFGGLTAFSALEDFFSLDLHQCEFIFRAESYLRYDSPLDVVDHINDVLEGRF